MLWSRNHWWEESLAHKEDITQSYEMPYAGNIRLEKFFDSGDFQCTIKGSKSKEAIDGIVKKSPQCHNPQVEEVTSDQQVKCKSLASHKNSLFTV